MRFIFPAGLSFYTDPKVYGLFGLWFLWSMVYSVNGLFSLWFILSLVYSVYGLFGL